jgi:hypothetical protein
LGECSIFLSWLNKTKTNKKGKTRLLDANSEQRLNMLDEAKCNETRFVILKAL